MAPKMVKPYETELGTGQSAVKAVVSHRNFKVDPGRNVMRPGKVNDGAVSSITTVRHVRSHDVGHEKPSSAGQTK